MGKFENFSQESNEVKEIDWVQQQVKEELQSLQKEAFYAPSEEGKVSYDMDTVKNYLTQISTKDWKSLNAKNTSAWIMAVQIALEAQGLDAGKVDGVFGAKTRAAVKQFQQAHGLKVDGLPGPETIKALLGSENTEGGNESTEGIVIEFKGIDPSTLGAWDGENFIFKGGIEKQDHQGTYIEIEGQKYYQCIGNFTGLGYGSFAYGLLCFGNYINGKLSGKGKEIWADGDVYEGEFKDGDLNGKGKKIINGTVYEGEFKDGKLNGQGKIIWADGTVYEGEFKDGDLNGKGKKIINGTVYEGEFKDDYLNGKGKCSYKNGTIYEGTWNDGKMNGKGKYTYKNGRVYEGSWLDGKWRMICSNGALYEGDFNEGKRNGKGKITYKNGGIYEGEWKNGKWNGQGKYTYKNGDSYEGEWKEGVWNGKVTVGYIPIITERLMRGEV